jgi:hypothetical protein
MNAMMKNEEIFEALETIIEESSLIHLLDNLTLLCFNMEERTKEDNLLEAADWGNAYEAIQHLMRQISHRI